MSLVECAYCRQMINADDSWIADEGILCTTCCKNTYASAGHWPKMPAASEHQHEWKKYTSFTHVYDLCECGSKKFSD